MIPLCTAPFVSYSNKPEGYRPCCSRHATPTIIEDYNWWNGEYMCDLRKRMFRFEDLLPECKACLQSYGAGNEKYSPKFHQDTYNHETGEMLVPPEQVYVFTGDRCNLACITCDSTFSDTHAKRFPDRILDVKTIHTEPMRDIHLFNPRQFVVYGGEPFLWEDIYPAMEAMIQKDSMISFLTNGMYPLKKLPVWELIKMARHKVTMTFSVDGDRETNEKIRLGASTKQILRNTKLCLEHDILTDIHFTISNMNAHNFLDFVQMLMDEGLFEYPQFSINACRVEFPPEYSPATLPQEEKLALFHTLKRYIENRDLPQSVRVTANAVANSLDIGG